MGERQYWGTGNNEFKKQQHLNMGINQFISMVVQCDMYPLTGPLVFQIVLFPPKHFFRGPLAFSVHLSIIK